MNMEKIELLLKMMEQPHDYSDQEWEEILQDEECRQVYDMASESRGALVAQACNERLTDKDIDEEWERLVSAHSSHTISLWRKYAAAVIAGITLSGLAMAAVYMGTSHSSESPAASQPVKQDIQTPQTHLSADTLQIDSVTTNKANTYDNIPLQTILTDMAASYHVQVEYHTDEAKDLRLYFNWSPEESVEEVIDRLNHFGQVSIRLVDNKLIVE